MVVIEQFHMGFLVDEVVLRIAFMYFDFSLSVSFHQCFILIFTYQPSLCR